MTAFTAPALAATLILVRDHEGLQVLMVERHGGLSFGPGALVFPGGKLDVEDADPAWAVQVAGAAALDPSDAALRICAIRETFEEAGVLLGQAARPLDQALAATLRQRVLSGALPFRIAVAELLLKLDLAALTPFARWITPQNQPVRFDATFYIAKAPAEQAAVCDGRETVNALWLSPAAALALADASQCKLMRPTRANLIVLSESESVEAVLAHARARPLAAVLPPA